MLRTGHCASLIPLHNTMIFAFNYARSTRKDFMHSLTNSLHPGACVQTLACVAGDLFLRASCLGPSRLRGPENPPRGIRRNVSMMLLALTAAPV